MFHFCTLYTQKDKIKFRFISEKSTMDNCHIYTSILAAVGAVTVFLLFIDTLWNILLSARAVLAPYMSANDEQNLVKRYGEWACKYNKKK